MFKLYVDPTDLPSVRHKWTLIRWSGTGIQALCPTEIGGVIVAVSYTSCFISMPSPLSFLCKCDTRLDSSIISTKALKIFGHTLTSKRVLPPFNVAYSTCSFTAKLAFDFAYGMEDDSLNDVVHRAIKMMSDSLLLLGPQLVNSFPWRS